MYSRNSPAGAVKSGHIVISTTATTAVPPCLLTGSLVEAIPAAISRDDKPQAPQITVAPRLNVRV